MINIAVADDQLLFRKGITALINSLEGFEVIIEAANGRELLEAMYASDNVPDLVLLDLNMPEMNGLVTLEQLKIKYPLTKIIMLTVHEEEKFIVKLIDAGANAYLAKNTEPVELASALTTVINHDFYFNDRTIAAMRNGFKYHRKKLELLASDGLTAREKEVLQYICREYTTSEISRELFLSERTIEGHRNNLLLKTGSKNTAGLVVFAVKHELYSVDGGAGFGVV